MDTNSGFSSIQEAVLFQPFRLRAPQVTSAAMFVTIFLILPGVFPAAAQCASQPILINADLTDAPRKLIHADMEMPVTRGRSR